MSDIGWFRPDGKEMTDDDWHNPFAKAIGVFLNGEELPDPDPRGQRLVDDSFLVLFNAHHEPLEFVLPGGRWASCGPSSSTPATISPDAGSPTAPAGP